MDNTSALSRTTVWKVRLVRANKAAHLSSTLRSITNGLVNHYLQLGTTHLHVNTRHHQPQLRNLLGDLVLTKPTAVKFVQRPTTVARLTQAYIRTNQ